MSLTADACGGPNPLVNLSQQLQSHNSYSYQNEAGPSSHSISDILNGLKLNEKDVQVPQQGSHASWQTEFSQSHKNRYTPETTSRAVHGARQISHLSVTAPFFAIPENISGGGHSVIITPSARAVEPRLNTFRSQSYAAQPNVSKKQLYNKAFESWVARYYPEVTHQPLEEVESSREEPQAKLSKELAGEWLKDFNLNEVLNVNSLSEAEQIIEQWIAEFTLGQQFNKPSYEELLQAENTYEEYSYLTKEGQAADLDIGIALLRKGQVTGAIEVFEELTRSNALAGKADISGVTGEAWYYLGLSHQHAEREDDAIAAFRNVPMSHVCYPSTLMSLSASYYNERRMLLATAALEDWITLKDGNSTGSTSTAESVRERFLAQQGDLQDVQLQTGVGVLSCILEEHGKAVDCFKLAVSLCPEDHLLWNRLGATLANADMCSEAVPAYHRALALCPGYVRARYNLGVACINLGAHREAVEHIVTGLCYQTSDTLWESLRLALCYGSFYQHLESADNRDLDTLVREFNIERPEDS